MASLIGHLARLFSFWLFAALASLVMAAPGFAAPYAAIVIDARTGEILYSENAEARLHPASLTKMMTLYIAFEEIQRGNISLDTMVTVSKHAAAQPPSRLGLRAGQKISLRNLIRAAAIKSANDAAAAIGDAIAGNEAAFAARMTRTAKALGMKNTTFKNAHGLTQQGHLSTAMDMTILGRHLFYDYPQYYNLFSRRSVDAGIATVNNTNRRFLDAYDGADGIKTGYTVAAGFNLTASAERGGKRLIATVFGGKSTADRNARMMKLLDVGFGKAPRNAPVNRPAPPAYQGGEMLLADADLPEVADGAGKTVRVNMQIATSPRPAPRPGSAAPAQPPETVVAAAEAVNAMQDGIEGALAAALAAEPPAPETLIAQATPPETRPDSAPDNLGVDSVQLASAGTAATDPAPGAEQAAAIAAIAPETRPDTAAPAPAEIIPFQVVSASGAVISSPRPATRSAPIYDDTAAPAPAAQPEPEVVISVSTSGERHWGVNVGRFGSSFEAERALLRTQLVETATLGGSLRKVMPRSGGFDATFVGLTQDQADLACRRLQARAIQCFTMGP